MSCEFKESEHMRMKNYNSRILGISRAPLWALLLAAGVSFGCEGPAGPAGDEGSDGLDGLNGSDGLDGTNGTNGATGANGTDGTNGDDGTNGTNGDDGDDGVNGVNGTNGTNGATGAQGATGNNGNNGSTGATGPQGPAGPAGEDGEDGVGGSGGPAPLVIGEPYNLALSTTGDDRFFGVTYDEDGNIYAVGQVSVGNQDLNQGNTSVIDAADSDFSVVLAKFNSDGEPDTSFGPDGNGVVVKNVKVGGTSIEIARGVVVQDDGKIVVCATVEHDLAAVAPMNRDTDIALLRFTTTGALDTTFDIGDTTVDGVRIHDLSTGAANSAAVAGADDHWSFSSAPGNKLVMHGTIKGAGLESDWALVRFNGTDGTLDTSFDTDGIVSFDIGSANNSARSHSVLSNGSIIGSGYVTSTVLGVSAQQPVLYKVDSNGAFDATFAPGAVAPDQWTPTGIWHGFATPDDGLGGHKNAEAYGAAVQSDGSIVTVGYGPTYGSGSSTDWVFFRFSGTGVQDMTWGNETVSTGDGATYIDPGGWGDNGRFVMALPDDRILAVGRGSRSAVSAQPERDAMVAILTEDGMPDSSFVPGKGYKLYDLGGGDDHFWAAAVSPDEDRVAIVGIAGAEITGLDNDDAAILILPLD
jgi:uncharacterized delta-60 repeat protein